MSIGKLIFDYKCIFLSSSNIKIKEESIIIHELKNDIETNEKENNENR